MRLLLITASADKIKRIRKSRVIGFQQVTMPYLAAQAPSNWQVEHIDEEAETVDGGIRVNKQRGEFIPALKYHWLTPFFDFFLKWLMPELQFRRRLIEQAGIEKDYRILDIGCGTGTLTVMIKGLFLKRILPGWI